MLVDEPAPSVRRLTLNRPAKRNALSNALRTQLFDQLRAGDADPAVRVIVIRGAGPLLLGRLRPRPGPRRTAAVADRPRPTAAGPGTCSRAGSR